MPPLRVVALGLGGCGTNAINHMVRMGLKGPVLIASNTDMVHLNQSLAHVRIQMGPKKTEGLGSGGDPEVGREAAEESIGDIIEAVGDAHLVFVTCGLGGGTGGGAAPYVAESLMKLKNPPLVVSLVTTPFMYESHRFEAAKLAKERLLAFSDTLIEVSGEKISQNWPKLTSKQCLAMADQALFQAVSCLAELIPRPDEAGQGFADRGKALSGQGLAAIGLGEASGAYRCLEAAKMAIDCSLMDGQSLKGAKFIIMSVTAPDDLSAAECAGLNEYLADMAGQGAQVSLGLTYDQSLAESGTVKVTAIAAGLPSA